MTDRDVMTLLAEANPVLADALAPMAVPGVAGRRSSRRLVLAAAATAVAASLIGVFVYPGIGSGHRKSMEPRLGIQGPGNYVVPPPPPSPIPVADVSLMLGVPVALPTTSLVQPGDAHSATAEIVCPAITAEIDGTCMVTVEFPSDSLTVEFWRPSGAPSQDQLADTVRQAKEEIARHPGSGQAELLDLNGVPARFLSGNYSFGPQGSGSIDFLLGDMRVTVYGNQTESALKAAAQSILDQTPSPVQTRLGDASSVFGAPIVLPDTEAVHPTDAAPTATTECPPQPSTTVPCQVTVEFPALATYYVPLTIRYLRPAQEDPVATYQNIAQQVKGAKIVSVSGVSALFVPGYGISYPSWIEFVAGGTDITVQGIYDESALQAMAQSIIDHSGS
jgi:hypothetical protein